MTDRFSQLSARDTAITLRSLGRRITNAATPALAAEFETVLSSPGPEGLSLDELLDQAARTQAFLLNEIARSLDHKDPVVPAATLLRSERHFVEARLASPADALASIRTDTQASAERVELADARALGRPVSVLGGGSTSPLSIAQEAARSGIDALGQIQTQVDWLVRSDKG